MHAPSNMSRTIKAAVSLFIFVLMFLKHEDENKQEAYGQRIRDIEQGVSPPRLLNHMQVQQKARKTSRYARLEIRKKTIQYSNQLAKVHASLSFTTVRSSIMYIDIRGTRSSKLTWTPT